MDVTEKYLKKCKIKNLSPVTIQNYKYVISAFQNFYAGEWDKLTQDDIDDYVILLQETYEKTGSINSKLMCLRAFIKWLQSEDIVNPKIKIPQLKTDIPEIQTFETNHLLKLYDACLNTRKNAFSRYRDYTIMVTLLETGIRLGELVSIKLKDLDTKLMMIEIRRSKNRKPRPVFYTSQGLGQVIRKYLNLRQQVLCDRGIDSESEYLFITTLGNKLCDSSIKKKLNFYGEIAGIKDVRVSAHTFRHTFAKRFLMNSDDLYTLCDLMGHSSLEMTYRYARLFSDNRRKKYLEVMGKNTCTI